MTVQWMRWPRAPVISSGLYYSRWHITRNGYVRCNHMTPPETVERSDDPPRHERCMTCWRMAIREEMTA